MINLNWEEIYHGTNGIKSFGDILRESIEHLREWESGIAAFRKHLERRKNIFNMLIDKIIEKLPGDFWGSGHKDHKGRKIFSLKFPSMYNDYFKNDTRSKTIFFAYEVMKQIANKGRDLYAEQKEPAIMEVSTVANALLALSSDTPLPNLKKFGE